MNNLCAVYIARKKEGLFSHQRFMTSLKGSHGYDLIVVYKGFSDYREEQEWREHEPQPSKQTAISMGDFGYDLTAYRRAAEASRHEFMVFFNSSTELRTTRWPQIYLDGLEHGYGLVGASASYESFQHGVLRRLVFPSFPNPHIRTNAFAMPRELFLKVWPSRFYTKAGCHIFESGYNSLTRRVADAGYQVTAVGIEEHYLRWYDWRHPFMFRANHQSSLIATDTQTRRFDELTPNAKLKFRNKTWGRD